MDYVQLLNEADGIVKSKCLYKRFIESTPLENDIAVWMADFAFERLESDLATSEQDSRQKQARIDRLEKAVRELREACSLIFWSNDSGWQADMAQQALKNTEDT